MSGIRQVLTVAQMQIRDLLRRRIAMSLFVLLGLAFYYSVPGTEDWAVLSGALGLSWAVAGAGVFVALGWRQVDTRLVLAGGRPVHAVLGRLLVLTLLAAVLVAAFIPQMLARSQPEDPAALATGLALMGLLSVPTGLAIGTLLPRELEAVLVLIGVIGIESSLPPGSALATSLPLNGPIELIQISVGLIETDIAGALLHAGVSFVGVTALALGVWWLRARVDVHRPLATGEVGR